MGRLILCYAKKANNPYFVKTMNLNLYTLEELCYFLYDNLYWIDETVINDELSDWILKELQLIELNEELKLNRGSVKNFVMIILKYAGYVSTKDMDDAGKLLLELDEQSDVDKILGRAGHLLQCRLYMEAILEYKKLSSVKDSKQSEKIYNNMGVAYAGLFLHKEAAKCFQHAYMINKDPVIYKHFTYAVAMLSKEEMLLFEENLSSDYKEVFQIAMKDAINEKENKKLNQLKAVLDYKDNNQIAEYYKRLDSLLSEWKKEYMNYMG